MATAELTERQQEIKDLIDGGMTPPEIAKKLGMTDNNVYQHLRRMKNRNGNAPKAGAKTKAGRKAASRARASAPRPAPPMPTSPVSFPTPLQAIRHRRDEIESDLKAAAAEAANAQKAAERAVVAHKALVAKHAAERKALDSAQTQLGRKPVAAKPASKRVRARKRPAAKRAAAKPAATTSPAPPAGTAAAAG